MFTEGLDWSAGGDAPPSASKKAADEGDDIEAQVQKSLQDALKDLPK
jgi:hypothetical protein